MAQMVKNLPAVWETWVKSLSQEHPHFMIQGTHSSILAWRVPWTQEPWGHKELDMTERLTLYMTAGFLGGGSGKKICLGFDPWVRKIPWRRERLPTPVILPEEFHGQWSLVGYSP